MNLKRRTNDGLQGDGRHSDNTRSDGARLGNEEPNLRKNVNMRPNQRRCLSIRSSCPTEWSELGALLSVRLECLLLSRSP